MGTFLKSPRFPIFVVSSGEHLTVLFGAELGLVRQSKQERLRDLVRSFSLSNLPLIVVSPTRGCQIGHVKTGTKVLQTTRCGAKWICWYRSAFLSSR